MSVLNFSVLLSHTSTSSLLTSKPLLVFKLCLHLATNAFEGEEKGGWEKKEEKSRILDLKAEWRAGHQRSRSLSLSHARARTHAHLPWSITYIGVEHTVDLSSLGQLAEVPVPVQERFTAVQDLHDCTRTHAHARTHTRARAGLLAGLFLCILAEKRKGSDAVGLETRMSPPPPPERSSGGGRKKKKKRRSGKFPTTC